MIMHDSKNCFKCNINKPLSEFYKHKMMADGHLNKCIDCAKKDVNLHRKSNLLRIRSYDIERGKLPHRKAQSVINTRFIRANTQGYLAAHNKVARALKNGTLERMPCCMCGTLKNIHAHHDDYSKQLEVMWLCVIHHKSRHAYLDYIKKDTF